MTTRAKLTAYSALATALAALCMMPLLTTRGWLTHAFLVVAVIAAVGAGLRRAPLYRWTVPLGQLLVLFLLMLLGFAGAGGVLPGPATLRVLGQVFSAGLDDIQQYAIPAPPSAGLRLILVSAVGLIAVAVDTVAVTYRRSALAGLPLLALYSVGNGLAGEHSSWVWFAAAAVGYLLLLFAEGQDRVSRWGRVFYGGARGAAESGKVNPGGRQVGVLALAVALLLPVVLPNWSSGLLDSGSGGSNGKRAGGSLSTSLDPLVSLEAAITKPTDAELLTYTMESPLADQIYLRTGSLDQFDGTNWKLGSTAVTDLPATLPTPEGLRNAQVPRIEGEFKVTEQLGGSSWLPMPYPAATVQVPNRGDWKLDPLTRTVLPANDKAIRGLEYHVSALDLRPTATELRLAASAPSDIREHYTAVPADLPPVVAEKAKSVTAGARNDYDRATALVNWFTGPDFTYDTSVNGGTGNNAIAVFLQDRRGFCVHFASTMAAMARVLKIPARVAVGFTPGDSKGGDKYSVTGRMYHAWPELYFAGYGWLRFEPTPSRGVPARYTDTSGAPTTAPTQQATSAPQTASAAPAPTSSSDCTPKQRQLGECGTKDKAVSTAAEESWLLSGQVLGTLAAVLVLIALMLVPMLWRTALRRRRLGGGGRRGPGGGPAELTDAQVLAAWDELIDSAWDLGIPPDESRTPRSAARRITEKAKLDADSAAATGRLALATERVLYAPPGQAATEPLAADVRTVRRGMLATAGRAGRTRALLLPPSSAQLWWRISDAVRAARTAVGTAVERMVETLSAPARRVRARRKRSTPES
ncbi:DUF3488 and DUF4129 domain-containing transglutaminase family protein [Kitasatospora sp. NPDC048286]|uniref:transglutaminase TgpA family protein n=1 Tax=Kitasatospora sp. NPDC048286 TaxID=3364047 RepID=UPI003721230A